MEERRRFKGLRVRGSGRLDSRAPAIAPYNFAINQNWYDMYKDTPTHRDLLIDYNSYGDPKGFGTNKSRLPSDIGPPQDSEPI